jgi:hypothetical protein
MDSLNWYFFKVYGFECKSDEILKVVSEIFPF